MQKDQISKAAESIFTNYIMGLESDEKDVLRHTERIVNLCDEYAKKYPERVESGTFDCCSMVA